MWGLSRGLLLDSTGSSTVAYSRSIEGARAHPPPQKGQKGERARGGRVPDNTIRVEEAAAAAEQQQQQQAAATEAESNCLVEGSDHSAPQNGESQEKC